LVAGLNTTASELPQILDRFGVFETFVHAVDRATVTEALHHFVMERRPRQLVTVNVDFLRIARALPRLKDVINRADLAVADGVPLLWLARYLGLRQCERITGPDLIELAARLSAERGLRLYFLGGTSEALEGAKSALEGRYPGVQVCGMHAPPVADYPFTNDLDHEICSRIKEAAPDVLFVGFGCPKQDLWINDHMEELQVPVSVGIGGSFNFLAGRVSRAPERLQRAGLEWAYRLWAEPRRLWRRYLAQDMPFFLRLVLAEAITRLTRSPRRALTIELGANQTQ
jgi:N-acetylglucosaminyldiphosphoundecaprenol N-acetyl-beta-D-mannosaminyltransferase